MRSALAAIARSRSSGWSRLNQSVLRWAGRLRSSGLKTAMLSNMHQDMVQKIRSESVWAEGFDCLTLSSEIGSAKPEVAIFRHCLDCLQVAPHEALFVDDREINLQAARTLGMRAVQFRSVAQLKDELAALGFPIVPTVAKSPAATSAAASPSERPGSEIKFQL